MPIRNKERNTEIENESFMLSCLKMAETYVGTVEAEVRLYTTRKGHKKLSADFYELRRRLQKLQRIHRKRLNTAMDAVRGKGKKKCKKETLHKPKKQKLKKPSPSSSPKKRSKLKRRA